MESISFTDANLPNARKLLKNLCVINYKNSEKTKFMRSHGIDPKKYEGPYNESESALRARVEQLEEDLLKTSEERDAAMEENRARIDELTAHLLTIREGLKKLIRAKLEKEKRIRQLEEKISGTVKVKSHVSSH